MGDGIDGVLFSALLRDLNEGNELQEFSEFVIKICKLNFCHKEKRILNTHPGLVNGIYSRLILITKNGMFGK